jgi:hypothetical protein
MRPGRLFSYLAPSLVDVLFISLVLALAYGSPSLRLLNDPGIGWHIRTGEWILQNHAIPHTDLFSNVTTRPWFAWEWLFDLGVGKVHAWWGLNGVLAGGAIVIALTFALLFRLTLRRGASLLPAMVFVVLAVLASTIHGLARPHLFTWLFTLLCWYLIEEKRSTIWFWAIPGIVLVWANIHGGFLVAFALMGLTLAGDLWNFVGGRDDHARADAVRVSRVLAAALVASFVNPYGTALYSHIYEYLTDSFLMQHIQEMQSPDFRTVAAKCLFVLLLLTLSIAIVRRSRLRPGEMLVLVFFAYEALFAARNIPLACIVLTLTVAPVLAPPEESKSPIHPLRRRLRGFSDRMGAMEFQTRGHLWAIAFTVVTLGVCAHGGRLLGTQVIDANFNADRFPVHAVDFVVQHPPTSPLFTTDAWGGYVIYRAWPTVRVVVDDRHDMYGSEYMKRYLKVVEGNWDWQQQLQATGAGAALVSPSSAIGSLLRLSPAWRLIYDDGQALIFETTEPAGSPPSPPGPTLTGQTIDGTTLK